LSAPAPLQSRPSLTESNRAYGLEMRADSVSSGAAEAVSVRAVLDGRRTIAGIERPPKGDSMTRVLLLLAVAPAARWPSAAPPPPPLNGPETPGPAPRRARGDRSRLRPFMHRNAWKRGQRPCSASRPGLDEVAGSVHRLGLSVSARRLKARPDGVDDSGD